MSLLKDETGAVLVVESAMTIPLVMLCVLLFILSAMVILQKNQMYYEANDTLNRYVNAVNKNMSVEQLRIATETPEMYTVRYEKPRPYRLLYQKTSPIHDVQSLSKALIMTFVPTTYRSELLKHHTTNMIQKKVTLEINYDLGMMPQVIPEALLTGNLYVSAPVLNSYDFVHQVDLASEILSQQKWLGKQMSSMTILLQRVNSFLRQLVVK